MKEREELKPYENEIKKYVTECTVGIHEERKTRKALAEIVLILQKNAHTWPNESDIEEYRIQSEERDNSNDKRTTKQNISRISKFFEWLRKENTPMKEEAQDAILATLPEEESTIPMFEEEAQPEEVKPKGKAGRKRLDSENGEIRNRKLTVYMTDTQLENFKALCLLKHINSEADYVLRLIVAEINRNEKALNFFREAEKLIE